MNALVPQVKENVQYCIVLLGRTVAIANELTLRHEMALTLTTMLFMI